MYIIIHRLSVGIWTVQAVGKFEIFEYVSIFQNIQKLYIKLFKNYK